MQRDYPKSSARFERLLDHQIALGGIRSTQDLGGKFIELLLQ